MEKWGKNACFKNKRRSSAIEIMDVGRGILQGDSLLPFYDVWHLSHPCTI
jgi:hypothetical protein